MVNDMDGPTDKRDGTIDFAEFMKLVTDKLLDERSVRGRCLPLRWARRA